MSALFFAVLSEAKPWLELLQAKPLSPSGKFRIFQNESHYIIISGTGKLSMALAVSEFAHTLSKVERNQMKIWNLGIAGANQIAFSLGDHFWIHKVTDAATGKDFYPDRIINSQFKNETNLKTFDRPITKEKKIDRFFTLTEHELDGVNLVDMEGSGFFAAASLYFPLENIAIAKVVSDHLEGKFCQSNDVEMMMAKIAKPLYEEWISPLPWNLGDNIESDDWPKVENFIKDIRLTETMKHDLKKSIRFFRLRNPNSLLPFPEDTLKENLKSKTDLKHFFDEWRKTLHV
ncbi:phosphorylase [Leptospira sp. 2 VSF19]|uniref:Phosphorylase n=1 Tax=Leptospira soteropolitanensis TaxID=2950025 RepID=A0AAW5VP20_9LEPT|nr:phosphorylase [Leptospira soteropolitanensis]MCW7494305.1 phosphorylase [Leptospira soteropolitanensis]MCW7501986.1 phosphorylase [Leptospira soteropolitanensis]MCW7524151.1 phosphorylase [Leptospira soteropolitanensis]MCW7528016.1 phosphorylase [Leptospira soteropolitanensis]MCW7531870.1 phosphorylase [Leptospira soteropolitanensis]